MTNLFNFIFFLNIYFFQEEKFLLFDIYFIKQKNIFKFFNISIYNSAYDINNFNISITFIFYLYLAEGV